MVNTPDVLVPSLSTSPSHSTTPAVCDVEPPLPSVVKPLEPSRADWQSVACAGTPAAAATSTRRPAKTAGDRALRTDALESIMNLSLKAERPWKTLKRIGFWDPARPLERSDRYVCRPAFEASQLRLGGINGTDSEIGWIASEDFGRRSAL